MRTDNGKVRRSIISVYFIFIIIAILLVTVFSVFKDVTNNAFVIFGIITALFLIVLYSVHAIARYFEYDSDGVKVVIINRGLLLADRFNYRENKVEFYKKDLKGYHFKNYLVFKVLKLRLNKTHDHGSRYKFNITLVSKRKRKYIRQSLSKMLKENKKNTKA